MTAGPLILAGGAEFDERMADADRVWLAAKKTFRPRVGVFPTAAVDRPDKAAANGVAYFRKLITHSEPVMVTTRETAFDPRIVDQVAKLDFAYFAGGNPAYLAETLAGTPVWEALVLAWRAGMGLGGSSAGAMSKCEAIYVQERWAEGLGIVPGAVCLPHFNRRDEASVERARTAVAARGYAGLGVDESTALIWLPGEGWRAAGRGRVTLLLEEGTAIYEEEGVDRIAEPAFA